MSSQTHSWPRNNINIFQKDTYKYKGGHSLHKCLILPVHIKSWSRWNIAPISWIYLWLAMEAYSQMYATTLLGKLSPLFKSLHRIRECTDQEGAPFIRPLVLVSMHIWCCVHLVETCWHWCIQASFKEIQQQWKKKENSCIERKGCSLYVLAELRFSFRFVWTNSITLFELTSALRKERSSL